MGFWKNGPDTLAAGVHFAPDAPYRVRICCRSFSSGLSSPAHSGLSALKVCTLLMCGILNFRSRQRDL